MTRVNVATMHIIHNQAYSEYKHSLTFHVRCYVFIATKPVHRLQIRPIDTTTGRPLPFPQVSSGSVQQCWNAARDRQTVTDGRGQYTFHLGYASREM